MAQDTNANFGDDPSSEQFSEQDRPTLSASILVTLKESAGLRRLLEVIMPDGVYFVEYNGRGFGYETVLVNGRVECQPNSLLWFVPRFEFKLGRRRAVIEVGVWPWLRISSFRLRIAGEVVYEEG